MRPRFSLRAFLLATALIAAFCYYWLVLPSVRAKQFVEAIADKQYQAADDMFLDRGAQLLNDLADNKWAFQARPGLLPLTWSQILHGERHAFASLSYFALDNNVHHYVQVAATPRGLVTLKIEEVMSPVSIAPATAQVPF